MLFLLIEEEDPGKSPPTVSSLSAPQIQFQAGNASDTVLQFTGKQLCNLFSAFGKTSFLDRSSGIHFGRFQFLDEYAERQEPTTGRVTGSDEVSV